MLFIFRKLRRSFFLPGKVRTYCAYAAGEIILIVVGILLALQISEWNQARRDRAEETSILLRLKEEFVVNQEQLEENESLYREIAEDMRKFLSILKPKPEKHPDELIHRHMSMLYFIPAYKPNQGVISSLIATDKIALIENENLRSKLNAWPTEVEKYNYQLSLSNSHAINNLDYFSDFHSTRDSMIDLDFFNETKISDSINSGHTGPSNFPYDQQLLLSMRKLESVVELKRIVSEMILVEIISLLALQQSILTLIDAELAERGIGGEE